jgi:hypothetical protein
VPFVAHEDRSVSKGIVLPAARTWEPARDSRRQRGAHVSSAHRRRTIDWISGLERDYIVSKRRGKGISMRFADTAEPFSEARTVGFSSRNRKRTFPQTSVFADPDD